MRIIEAQNEKDLNQVYHVRKAVFVGEQKVALEIEIDEHESESIHFLGLEDNQPIGASRLRIIDDYGKLERICILKAYRGKSLGQQMIQRLEESLMQRGIFMAKLNAQTHAISFYEKLGYEVISDEFMDAGIPHRTMIKQLSE